MTAVREYLDSSRERGDSNSGHAESSKEHAGGVHSPLKQRGWAQLVAVTRHEEMPSRDLLRLSGRDEGQCDGDDAAATAALAAAWRGYRGGGSGLAVRILDSGERRRPERLGCTFPLHAAATEGEWQGHVRECLHNEWSGEHMAGSILRADLPHALFSPTLRLSASPIGFLFDEVEAVAPVDAAAFPHDIAKLRSRPRDLRSRGVPQCRQTREPNASAAAYAYARTEVFAEGKHPRGAAKFFESPFHCWQPRPLWNHSFDSQRAYALSLIEEEANTAGGSVEGGRAKEGSSASGTRASNPPRCRSLPGHQ